MRHWAVVALAACLLMLNFVPAVVVHAATLTANDAATLIAAINTANATPEFDVITLTGNVNLLTLNNTVSGNTGLPVITSDIRIIGNGNVISRDAGLSACVFPPAADQFRFFMVQSGTLHLHNVTLLNGCDAFAEGGAVLTQPGTTLILTQVTAQNNTATRSGGAITAYGDLQVYDSDFIGNASGAGGGGDGGAIALSSTSSGLISGSTFNGNSTDGSLGGGAVLSAGILTVRNSTFSNNQATFPGSGGGGLLAFGVTRIENSTFNDNSAPLGGGIFAFVNPTTVTIINSTISDNTATNGGGVAVNSGAALTINNSTILNNTATGTGGGIWLNIGSTTLNNSIVSGNTGVGPNCVGAITGADNGSNTAECPGITRTVIVGTDIAAARAGNGGLTQTHALLAGSSAENATGAGPTNGDQRGAGANGIRDMGAFELTTFALPSIDFDAPPAIALEAGGGAPMTLTATTRIVGQILVNVFDSAGTATQGADYTSFFSTVVFDCDANLCDLGSPLPSFAAVFPTEDNLVEVDETLDLNAVMDGTGVIGAGGATKSLAIRDFAIVSVRASIPDAVENPPTNGQFTVELTTTLSTGATITAFNATGVGIEVIYTVSGTATSGVDFAPLTLTAIIPVGQSNVTIDVSPVFDGLDDGGETVVVTLLCICVPAGLNITVIPNPATVTIFDTPPAVVSAAGAGVGGFDPSISKLGFGRVGRGEQVQWQVTVINTSGTAGVNVRVTDTLDSRFRIDRVDAPGGTVTISGQNVTVVYSLLNVGASASFSIFTTALTGDVNANTACVTADNQGTTECFTGSIVSRLPSTGELPLSRSWLIVALMMLAGGLLWARKGVADGERK